MSSKKYIIAIDQSTQGTKAMIIDNDGQVVAATNRPHKQIITAQGWVEHDPEEIAANLLSMVREMVTSSYVDKKAIVGVGVANQRETVAVWNRKTGKPVYNAIVWQCNRATAQCERIEKARKADFIRETTGLKLSPFFSGPKIAWILDNVSGAREAAKRGELACGTMDCWVIWTLTNGKVHKSDYSNCSRMMLMDLKNLCWSDDVCKLFDIPKSMLPEICDSDALFGYTDFGGLLDKPVPIHGDAGDSHACLYAQGCFEKGSVSAGCGTGTCVIMNIGDKFVLSDNGLLTSIAWKTKEGLCYAYDGVINYSGAVITWLYKDLGLVSSPAETQELAMKADPNDRTILVPAFTGIGAPYWSNESNGVFWGMSRTTRRAELVKAGLESMDYQIADVIKAMEQDSGSRVPFICCSGGPAKNDYLMQFLSDMMDSTVLVPSNEEMTCLGAAILAGKALGIIDLSVLERAYTRRKYTSAMAEDTRLEKQARWNLAVKQTLCR